MDKLEFIKQRCKIDGITEEKFEEIYRVVKCDCGMPYCKGYRCLDIDDLYNELKKKDEVIEKAVEYVNKHVKDDYYCRKSNYLINNLLQILEDKGD